ncbi:TauD/TfdA family dioxygenase [Reyranella sp. CPCC 100927]|uniref:TauD/TfdA family dioxygenase n=1 Tax=Reyranella sp. CPCC 100927 TaxID=2599616 RepID=UPI0011B61F2E|nr:TauD/TfdA family dioxygenase [Reyranella sp. CPCC 100927]TWT13708.1 TauD/TfdA family dioxygenase [Reyranella sp. CPCC 100927]
MARTSPAMWTAADVQSDTGWILRLSDDASAALLAAVRGAGDPDRPLLDWRREDFALGPCLPTLAAAFREVRDGRGMALVKNLPRAGVTAAEFRLMTWAIGLHFGVARPQNRASDYITAVQDAGTTYRSPTGRGYSSNAELDFHVDSADVVLLSCYNQAPVGGMSLCVSAATAYAIVQAERPDYAAALASDYTFSRNGEQADGEAAWYPSPICTVEDGRVFCKWNRNRLENAQKLDGVPRLSAVQRAAMEYFDAVLRRPQTMFSMHLEAGDLQLLCNHTMLHSRTGFEDHAAADRKRTLYRLWLAPPDWRRLPEGWAAFYGTAESGAVRGGIRGHQYDVERQQFDARQGAAMGMRTAA